MDSSLMICWNLELVLALLERFSIQYTQSALNFSHYICNEQISCKSYMQWI